MDSSDKYFSPDQIEDIRRQVNLIIDLALERVENQVEECDKIAEQEKEWELSTESEDSDAILTKLNPGSHKIADLIKAGEWAGEFGNFYFPFNQYYAEGWQGEGEDYDFKTLQPEKEPFRLEWCYGYNLDVTTPLISLKDGEFFYSASHLGIIYDISMQHLKPLLGHKNKISCIAQGPKCIATADKGEKRSLVILWDTTTHLPIQAWTQSNPGTQLLKFSPSGTYLFIVSASFPTSIKRWVDAEERIAEATIQYDDDDYHEYKQPTHIATSCYDDGQCILTFLRKIYIISGEDIILKTQPSTRIVSKRKVGLFRMSCSIEKDHQILTGTSRGQLIVWDKDGTYLKTLQLTPAEVTWLQFTINTVVVAFMDGTIGLYDQQLKLKNFCHQDIGQVQSIIVHECSISAFKFTISTTRGIVAEVSPDGHVNYAYKGCCFVTTMEVNPTSPYIVAGDDEGKLFLYSAERRQPEMMRAIQKRNDIGVSALKFSPVGNLLAAGFTNGDLLLLDPILLNIKEQLLPARTAIKEIDFSTNGKYLAYYHEAFGVALYKCLLNWVFKGKYRGHSRCPTGILFVQLNLYTTGQDGRLIEYDVRRGLRPISATKIEQTAYPTAIVWNKDRFLIANNEFKIRIIDRVTKEIIRTIQGPEQSQISTMKCINDSLIFAAGEYIGEWNLSTSVFSTLRLAHSNKVQHLAVTEDFVFTAGKNDTAIFMWSLDESQRIEIPAKPLPQFIDEKISLLFKSGPIPTVDVIDALRYLGFFPSDFEAANILRELDSSYVEEEEFRVIYYNHKPVNGLTIRDIEAALLPVCEYARRDEPVVVIDRLVKALEMCEEPLKRERALWCLNVLLEPSMTPPQISVTEFFSQVLGICERLVDNNSP